MTRRAKFQTPSGTHDILPGNYQYYKKIYQTADSIVSFYGFSQIENPVFEESELFSKAIGMTTEIIEKQMYTLKTKGGDFLTLRPEATAGIVRAYIQHGMQNLPQPVKLWCFGRFYRYERPQAGRYREFYQLNLETLGEEAPLRDAQIIQIFLNILTELGLKNLTVNINSIGDNQCQPYYKKILVSFLKKHQDLLCLDCKKRLQKNPLRCLDCKREKCQKIIERAPQILDHLCKACKSHFEKVLELLDETKVFYNLSPYLARGLDYYTKTVFEIFSKESSKEGNSKINKNALVGGGRYDNLVRALRGKDVPACGGAMGVERVVEKLKERGIKALKSPTRPQIFIAQLGRLAQRKSLGLLEEFRKANIEVAEALGKNSLIAQLNLANKAKVKYVLILGQKEALEKEIIIRDMRTGKQKTVKIQRVITEIKQRLKKHKL